MRGGQSHAGDASRCDLRPTGVRSSVETRSSGGRTVPADPGTRQDASLDSAAFAFMRRAWFKFATASPAGGFRHGRLAHPRWKRGAIFKLRETRDIGQRRRSQLQKPQRPQASLERAGTGPSRRHRGAGCDDTWLQDGNTCQARSDLVQCGAPPRVLTCAFDEVARRAMKGSGWVGRQTACTVPAPVAAVTPTDH